MENRLEVYLRTLNCPWCYKVGLLKDPNSPVPDSITILDDNLIIGTVCTHNDCEKLSLVQLASVTINQFMIEGTAATACSFYGDSPAALRKKALCGKRLEAYQSKKTADEEAARYAQASEEKQE